MLERRVLPPRVVLAGKFAAQQRVFRVALKPPSSRRHPLNVVGPAEESIASLDLTFIGEDDPTLVCRLVVEG
jgi:hypothetical protein